MKYQISRNKMVEAIFELLVFAPLGLAFFIFGKAAIKGIGEDDPEV